MSQQRIPLGWDAERQLQRLIAHYDALDENHQVAEDEAAQEQPSQTTAVVPIELYAGNPTDAGREGGS